MQVGTAHGRTLEALMRNGELNGLVGADACWGSPERCMAGSG